MTLTECNHLSLPHRYAIQINHETTRNPSGGISAKMIVSGGTTIIKNNVPRIGCDRSNARMCGNKIHLLPPACTFSSRSFSERISQ